jgi:hypothetical protein
MHSETQPEISNDRMSTLIDENIRRLQISVYDSLAVDVRYTFTQFGKEPENLARSFQSWPILR